MVGEITIIYIFINPELNRGVRRQATSDSRSRSWKESSSSDPFAEDDDDWYVLKGDRDTEQADIMGNPEGGVEGGRGWNRGRTARINAQAASVREQALRAFVDDGSASGGPRRMHELLLQASVVVSSSGSLHVISSGSSQ